MSQDARWDEEQNTQKRAQILNLPYVDTTELPIASNMRVSAAADELAW